MPRRPEEESGNCRQRGRHPRPDFRPAERLAAPGCRRFKRGRSCPMGRISRATQPLQVRPKLGGALIAHLAVLLDRLVDDPLELDRQLGVQTRRGDRDAIQYGIVNDAGRVPAERQPARGHFVENGAKAEQVGPRVKFFAAHLLGRHISHRA